MKLILVKFVSHCMFISIYVRLTVCLSHYMFGSLYVCFTVCLSHCLFVSLYVLLTVCLSRCVVTVFVRLEVGNGSPKDQDEAS